MSLGKGLESLIPPKKPVDPARQNPQDPPADPAQATPLVTPNEDGLTFAEKPTLVANQLNKAEIDVLTTAPAIPDNLGKEAYKPAPKEKDPSTNSGRGEAIFQIEVDQITSNPHQPRRNFEEEGLKELAASIREFGVLQPIIVSKIERETETGRTVEYELIAGERRLMASRLAGLRTVPAIIRKLTPEREKLEIAIIENIQRRDLDPIEEAKAFARLQDEFKLTQREIAAKLGKSREAVANAVRLLNLPSDIQQALSERKISESQGRLLLSIDDIGEQQRMFQEVMKGGGLSIREMRLKIQKKKDMATNEMVFVKPETLALKEKLEEFLGTKVDLREEGDKGKITINFYSQEELRAILDKFFKQDDSQRP